MITYISTKKRGLFIIISLTFVSLAQAYWVQSCFSINNLPVYDGVMYEKQQILRYLAFKDNFSFIERYNQFFYELTGNPVSGGFTSLTCLINPKWLENGFNIYVRSFFAMFVFLWTIYLWLHQRIKDIPLFIVLLLITQIPIFYHFRFGLGSYVPDVPAALYLASAYLITYLVLERQISFKLIYLMPLLVSIALFSRFNFYAYSVILFLVFFIKFWRFIRQEGFTKSILFFLVILSSFLFVWIFYGLLHFKFFLYYYAKPVEFQHVDFKTSLTSLWLYFKTIHGWSTLSIIVIIYICLKFGKKENCVNSIDTDNRWIAFYPAVILFFFLYVLLNATNQPHVNSAWFVLLLIASIGITVGWTNISFPTKNRLAIASALIIVFASLGFLFMFRLNEYKKGDDHSMLNLLLFQYIDKNGGNSPSYFFTHDTQLEIPFGVSFYRKRKIWLNNSLSFYFSNWNFYDIDKSLNPRDIITFYQNRIEKEKPRFITFPRIKLYNRHKSLPDVIKKSLENKMNGLGYKLILPNDKMLLSKIKIFETQSSK